MVSDPPLHIVELSGNSRQRGLQHGRLLKDPIAQAIAFYRLFFKKYVGLDLLEVRRRAARFFEPTNRLSPALMEEYQGIAEGASQVLEDIFALSARYEITFESVMLGECSNLYVGPQRSRDGHTLLGQNWDWRPEVLDFRTVFTSRCDDGPDHIMVTECGQPGKYGLNEYGLGVAAAGLSCSEKTSTGDQLFVALARAILASTSFSEAIKVTEQVAPRATVNLMLAAADGRAMDLEATPRGLSRQTLDPSQAYWHTNHCRQVEESCSFEDSRIRGRRWAELIDVPLPVTREQAKLWLRDRENLNHSICKSPDEAQAGEMMQLQTLCSIMMDLNERTLWVNDQPSSEDTCRKWKRFSIAD